MISLFKTIRPKVCYYTFDGMTSYIWFNEYLYHELKSTVSLDLFLILVMTFLLIFFLINFCIAYRIFKRKVIQRTKKQVYPRNNAELLRKITRSDRLPQNNDYGDMKSKSLSRHSQHKSLEGIPSRSNDLGSRHARTSQSKEPDYNTTKRNDETSQLDEKRSPRKEHTPQRDLSISKNVHSQESRTGKSKGNEQNTDSKTKKKMSLPGFHSSKVV